MFARLVIFLFIVLSPYVITCQMTGEYIIVIDAGHGGKDHGTQGSISSEKDITLNISEKLEQKFENNPIYDIILSRNDDSFIPLNQRTQIANSNEADLFISLHCNHIHLDHIHGTEVYVMGLSTSDEHLEIVKRENEELDIEYEDSSNEMHIFNSIFQSNYLEESVRLSQYLIFEFNKRSSLKQRGIKQAGFRVLKNASMPSVLIELAYLSNIKDEKYLLSEKGQNEVVDGIYYGILQYFKTQELVDQGLVMPIPSGSK